MAIIRIQNASNFTVINNDLINDPLLDWRDVGLLTFLLSKPDNWEVSTAHLQQQKNSGRDAIHASLRSIIAAGYAKRNVSRVGGWTYEVSNAPIYRLATTPNTENPNTENPNTENPNTENPNTEKRPQVNTEYKQILNTTVNTEITTTREGTILNEVQREIFVWASTHDYWHKATFSEEEFLRALCSPKGGMRKQFENRFKEPIGGRNASNTKPNQSLSASDKIARDCAEKFGNTGAAILEGECRPV